MDLFSRIVSVRRATPSTRVLRVRFAGPPLEYAAGQAAMIGPPGAALRVPYSISSAPEDTRATGTLEFLIKADAAEKWGPEQQPFRRGMPLVVEGPYGRFVFPADPTERRFLFVAGGTGIAPLRAMIRHAIARGLGGGIHLVYSARSADEFAYLREFRRMAGRGEISLALNVTRDLPARWRGARGRVAQAQLAGMLGEEPALCFLCGPAEMVSSVVVMLTALGVAGERIRVERWRGNGKSDSGPGK